MKNLFVKISLFLFLWFFIFVDKLSAWPWSRDMYQSPVSKYNNAPLKEAESIPRGGVNPTTLAKRKFQNPILVKNALSSLQNPIPPTEESLKNGERLYKIYCLPCHGESGRGDGAVAKKMVPPQDLTSDYVKSKSDGYIFATISGGGVIMPAQKKGLSEKDIWDIVNYIRVKIQGMSKGTFNAQQGGGGVQQ